MLITNKTDSCIGIPMAGQTDLVNLVPGVQDVPNERYALARGTAKRWVDGGFLVEEFVKVEEKEIKAGSFPDELILPCTDAKDEGKKLVPAKTMDIDRRSGDKLSTLIRECFHLPTLNKWIKEELRADVRMEMLQQKALIEESDKMGNKE
jgi:hypothetical protein